jgi:hypothetical protein
MGLQAMPLTIRRIAGILVALSLKRTTLKRTTNLHPQLAVNPCQAVYGAALTKTEAEDLLDWLEANGYPLGEVLFVPGKGFTVTGG